MEPSHTHGPGCGCAGYELSAEDDNLWEVVDHENIQCLNEDSRDSCKAVFRSESEKFNFGKELHSPADDPEIVLIIPFKEQVKIRCIQLISTDKVTAHPFEANCFKDVENVDFDIVDDPPTQNIPLKYTTIQANGQAHSFTEGTLNIKTFTNVQKLIVHLNSEEQIQLKYIAVKGIRQKHKRGVVHANYEISALAKDHKKENSMLNKNVNNNLI